ncbi:hypothetical protein BRADI_1g75542v3 [Brachypodium distachyon]|uniref:DUF4220 domain-containing protein n=1 Tax=Brachypodium distachyon TaxID=15368 RepID=A0A2K2DVC5_BRADI|nr:hypothetical protein BRADI_1g75542v3 [Brachypodium distachyon]
MGISSAVSWWEEWQLRVLVLASQSVQLLLFISAPRRKSAISASFRLLIWLAYLGSDAFAIYALAALFNRHKKQEGSWANGESILEVVWAPVLLMHLGGQDCITAYNMEDNELWRRHVLTALSQVTVSIYVFCKSWPAGDAGDKKLLQAAIMLFTIGVIRCIEKPLALKSASINSLASSSDTSAKTYKDKNGSSGSSHTYSLKEYVDENTFSKLNILPKHKEKVLLRPTIFLIKHKEKLMLRPTIFLIRHKEKVMLRPTIFLITHKEKPMLRPTILIKHNEKLMLTPTIFLIKHKEIKAMNLIMRLIAILNVIPCSPEDLIDYTRMVRGSSKIITIQLFWIFTSYFRIACSILPFAAIGLFHKSHREAYNDKDVKVTYILLCCTAVLEFLSYGRSLKRTFGSTLCGLVSQYNFVGFLARNEKYTMWMPILSCLKCKDYVDQHWCMQASNSSSEITIMVLGHVKRWWKDQHIRNAADYMRFNNHRGQWTIQQKGGRNKVLESSIKRSFDESVLVWHIATDLCFYGKGAFAASRTRSMPVSVGAPENLCEREEATPGLSISATGWCREMSNYMMYLLFAKPDMLMACTRRNLFLAAYDQLKEILEDQEMQQQPVAERAIAQKIITKVKESPGGGSFVHEAWDLAEALLAIPNEKEMWEVIQGVWVEMLCFSASRCRGYLHAKSLGTGGELLTFVWLLWSHMGMETLAERMQGTDVELLGSRVASTGISLVQGDPGEFIDGMLDIGEAG